MTQWDNHEMMEDEVDFCNRLSIKLSIINRQIRIATAINMLR